MLRRRVGLGVLVAMAIVGHARSTLADPPDPIYWDDDWVKLTIDTAHVAHYRFHSFGWGSQGRQDRRVDTKVSDAEFAALERVFVTQSACGLTSPPRHPVPEEHSKTLTLALPTLRCTVTMLTNDWNATPRATAVVGALNALIQKIAP